MRRRTTLGILAVLLAACGEDPAGLVPVASIEVTAPATSITAGQTAQLSATAKDASGNILADRVTTWSSDNEVVATVNSNGLVTAAAPGSVTITATAEEQVGRVTLTITPVPVAAVTITPETATLQVGTTRQITATARDANGNPLGGRTVSWSTSDAAVATVSTAGVVAAVGPGTASITATAEGKTASAAITVTPVPVASVTVFPVAVTIIVGSTQPLTVSAFGANGDALTGRAVTWTSSNTAVATVSVAGVVTAVAPGGPVAITATVEGKTAVAQVTVIPVPIATLTFSPNPAEVRVGLTTQLTLVARDSAGNELPGRTATLSTSNAAVATINADKVVTGVSAGTATITATAEGKTATATVNVVPGPVASVEVTPQAPSLREGATVQLTATTRDASGAVVTGRTITWASSNAGKAVVSSSGVVTGVAEGTATITATSEGKSASTTVTVLRAQVTSVRFSPLPYPFIVGDTVRARAVAVDSLGRELRDRAVTFSGSNNAVATVSSSGLASGITPGDVTITATTEGVSGTQVGTVLDVRASFGTLTCLGASVGGSCTVSATLRFAGSTTQVPGQVGVTTIESSDPNIARVGNLTYTQGTGVTTSATITGVAAGKVTITGRYTGMNGVTRIDSYTFTVSP